MHQPTAISLGVLLGVEPDDANKDGDSCGIDRDSRTPIPARGW
jgi:hypothetical protein